MENIRISCSVSLLNLRRISFLRLSRDSNISDAFSIGYYKPAIIHGRFLPPLSGVSGKTSSSSNNNEVILTTDSSKEVERKIKKYAFSGGRDTLEEHKRKGGNPDVDVSFQYLKFLFESDDKKLDEIYRLYKQGEMTTGELKEITIKKINTFLKEHQAKRQKAKSQISKFIYKI